MLSAKKSDFIHLFCETAACQILNDQKTAHFVTTLTKTVYLPVLGLFLLFFRGSIKSVVLT